MFGTNGYSNLMVTDSQIDANWWLVNELHLMQLSHTENQLGLMEMIEEAPGHDRTNYPELADSTHMAQQVKGVFFLSEEMGQAENLIVIDEDEVFSEQCLGTLH